tara:strand:+ start:3104 stop:3364 length:261 start_codon:yes stop_codon:yes gene_type:complete
MYENRHELVDFLKVEGKRYPLERGRLFKVKGQRGVYRVHEIYRNKETGAVEVHAWWRNSLHGGRKAMWRFVALDNVARILQKLETI